MIGQERLSPDQQSSLDRNGNVFRLQVLYRLDVKRHRFEPAVRYINDAHEGGAMANEGYGLRLTYLYLSPKVILDLNLGYGQNQADQIHPVYNEIFEGERWGAAITALFPLKCYENSALHLFATAETFREDANIDFFDSQLAAAFIGLIWRHRRE